MGIDHYILHGNHTGRIGPQTAAGERFKVEVSSTGPPVKRTNGHDKPSNGHAKDDFGIRAGTIKSIAANLYARRQGATLAEVKAVVGSVQYNVLTELELKGFAVERKPEDGRGGHRATRFFVRRK